MGRQKPKEAGFTVIELVIVAAIIILIAAIALPHLFSARKKANEASAIASIKAIQTAEAIYQNAYPAKGYSPSLINLGNNGSTCETTSPTNACLLDASMASGIKDGYIFDLLGDGLIPDMSYTVTAAPQSSTTGECTFSSDQSGIIQTSSGSATGAKSSANGAGGGGGSCGGS